METRKTPLVLTASALAMALVLVGCGGGGSSGSPSANNATVQATPPAMPEPPPVAEPEPMSITLPELPMGAMYAFMLDDGDHTIEAGKSLPAGGVMLSCPAGGEDCMVTVDGDTVTYTGVMVTAMRTEAADKALTEEKNKMMAERDGRTAGLFEALTNSAGSDVLDNGPGGQLTADGPGLSNGVPGITNIAISRDRGGDAMVIRDRAGWQKAATNAAALGADGWAGKVLSNDAATQTITVYTNIEAAARTDFGTDVGSLYASGQVPTDISHLPGASTDGSGQGADLGELHLTTTDMAQAAAQGLLHPTHFPQPGAPGSGTVTYTYQAGAVTDPTGRTFPNVLGGSTFHGASGTYECSGTCTVSATPATTTGPATYEAAGNWVFTPTPDGVGNDPQIVAQDGDWMTFGYWISRPKSAASGGEFLYNAHVFHGGADVFDDAVAMQALQGNATYKGRAAGLYAMQADAKAGTDSAHGEFMADASLTARFGNGTTANDNNVSGTINKFTNGDGVDMSKWALTLQRTALPDTASTANGVVGSATHTANSGAWRFTVYGPHTRNRFPSGIAGRFNALIDANTAVAGGFAAERQ